MREKAGRAMLKNCGRDSLSFCVWQPTYRDRASLRMEAIQLTGAARASSQPRCAGVFLLDARSQFGHVG